MIPQEIESELGRTVRRWHQLPLDRASEALPGVHAFLATVAGEGLPDLGPAVAMDQLRVVVFDACRDEGSGAGLAEALASLRLSWSAPPADEGSPRTNPAARAAGFPDIERRSRAHERGSRA